MTLIHSEKELRFKYDNRPRAIPAGVSDQPEDVFQFARAKRFAGLRRATKAEAEPRAIEAQRLVDDRVFAAVIEANSIESSGPEEIVPEVPDVVPEEEPKGVIERIAAAVRKPKVSPSR